jgi:hypothetical protein
MQILSNWGKFRINFREACYSFNVEDPKSIQEGYEDTISFMLNSSPETIAEYNKKDVLSLFELFKKVNLIFP